ALSPDGKYLAIRGYDSSVRIWNTTDGKELKAAHESPNPGNFGFVSYGMNGRVPTDLIFSPDGKMLALPVADDNVPMNMKGPGWGGMPARRIRLWDVARGKEIIHLEGSHTGISSLAFSPEGRTVA